MTEKQLRTSVVSIFESWLGYNETNGKHKKIIDIYNQHKPLARGYKVKYTDEWCATAVSAVFIQAGLTDIADTECSCSKMIELYKAKGRWQESDSYVPEPGDLIMYDWEDSGKDDNVGTPNHVGMVVSVSGKTIRVIEGNKGEAVAYRNLSVNGKYIRGYCLPDYASKTSAEVKPKIKVDPARSFDRLLAKTYSVTAYRLNMRTGANTTKKVIRVLEKGEKVTCYGYFTKTGSTTWLYVKDVEGNVGFCSKKYLK